MLNFIINIWDRMANNWKTSGVAILAGLVIVAQWFGWVIDIQEVTAVVAAIEAGILLFAKD